MYKYLAGPIFTENDKYWIWPLMFIAFIGILMIIYYVVKLLIQIVATGRQQDKTEFTGIMKRILIASIVMFVLLVLYGA